MIKVKEYDQIRVYEVPQIKIGKTRRYRSVHAFEVRFCNEQSHIATYRIFHSLTTKFIDEETYYLALKKDIQFCDDTGYFLW